MTNERYEEVSESIDEPLTEEEIKEGWHFCMEFDGLLVGPGMSEMNDCKCLSQCLNPIKD